MRCVSRALEVFELSGVPLSRHHELHAFERPVVKPRFLVIDISPDELTEKLERRIINFWRAGSSMKCVRSSRVVCSRAGDGVGRVQRGRRPFAREDSTEFTG